MKENRLPRENGAHEKACARCGLRFARGGAKFGGYATTYRVPLCEDCLGDWLDDCLYTLNGGEVKNNVREIGFREVVENWRKTGKPIQTL